jgi:hypothetical protein
MSQGELEIPSARLATTKVRLRELWIKAESAGSALLSGVKPVGYLTRHWAAAHVR